MIKLGVIGYGHRIQGVLDMISACGHKYEISAITDININDKKQTLKDKGIDPENVAFYTDADEMLDKEKLDGVLVGTRCSLHAKMGVKVLERNIPLYLEKPVATNMQDLMMLRNAYEKSKGLVVVSFPLRVTDLVQQAKEIIDSGKVGTIEHVEAWNDVPYGAVYYQCWYRDENETQGLFLQKATHDFDYINYLINIKPKKICAMTSKQVYKGDKPAGLKCEDCKEWDECLDSPFHRYFSKAETSKVGPDKYLTMCGFATDTGNEDSGSAIVLYETGMHVSYSQNFFARKKAGRRGARFYGYKGTVEFDWYTSEVKVYMHHAPRVETYKIETPETSHSGGDPVLADNFIRVIRGEQESVSPLSAGLLSVLICLKAKESAATYTFQDILYPDRGDITI